ncbi:MAG: hypothetical protein LKF42_08655 [Streptococcaceae bacterium]|nr:hypothetical protein [Streptococcaceae bacterium]MCH4177307.1 hypothetical protein [Streptococcaceae bacterium]
MNNKVPLLKVHDKNLKIVGFLPSQMYCDDKWVRKLIKGAAEVSTFDFSVYKKQTSIEKFLDEKCWISFNWNGRSYLFSAMKVDENEFKIDMQCESLNLELINETSVEYKATRAMSIVEYFNALELNLSQIKIGVNELSGYTRLLEWEGQDTKLARLISLVTKFDGELEFIESLNQDGTLKQITLNLYQKHSLTTQGVGTRREDVTLFWRKNIDSITRTVDKTGLYTAIKPIGKDGLTIASLDIKEYDDDGKLLYVSKVGDPAILCPSMAEEYPSQLQSDNSDKYIKLDWSYETDNVNTLGGQALAKFREISMPAVSYGVTGFFNAEIGDTLKINDNGFTPVLLLEARVTGQEISFHNPKANKTTFDNFRALQNKLSQGITNRLEQLVSGIIPTITCDKPTTMKNTAQDLYFTCQLMQGDKVIDEYGNLYEYYWTVTLYKEDGSVLTKISKLGKTTALMANEWLPSAVTFKVDLDRYEKVVA